MTGLQLEVRAITGRGVAAAAGRHRDAVRIDAA
jgi:hypothetical protein